MADISADPFSWSTTEASNAPTGATTIGTGLDDNLRAIEAGVKTAIQPIYGVTGASTSAVIQTGYFSRPPINVNPNWLIDQINEGALYTADASEQGPDGWTGALVGAGVFKMRTLADPDNAALKCLEISCTTADASIAATDNYYVYTVIEGYDSANLSPGTSSASQITIQFKMKSNSVTGVFGVAVQNSAGNRRYIGTITVPDTNENSYSVTLTLDTSGTWLYTNGVGLKIILTLAAGSNFQSTAGAWAAGAEQTTSSQANFMSANTNIIYLKRFHVIPGGVALAYANHDIQKELAKAQRQYCKTQNQGTAVAAGGGLVAGDLIGRGASAGDSEPFVVWQFPAEMRAAPSVTLLNPRAGGAANQWGNGGGTADSANARALNAGTRHVGIDNTGTTLSAASGQWYIRATANARLS